MSMSIRFLQTLIASSLLIPLQVLAVEYSSEYANVDYGFVAKLPRPMALCTTQPPGSNHGFVALLDSDSCEDARVAHARRIELFAFYNVLDAKKTQDLSSVTCAGAPAVLAEKGSELLGAGLHAYRCPQTSDGKKMVHQRYFFLKDVVFVVDLYTRTRMSKDDIEVLKEVLHGIRRTSL